MLKVLWIAGMTFGPLWAQTIFQSPAKMEPVPVQPWVADHVADRFENKNDHRVPILGAIKPGERPTCDDAPDQAEILPHLPRVTRGVPYIYEEFRDDIEFTVEKLVDRVDAPRFFPLLGPAQMHHCQWKCTVYFTETIDSAYPFPFQVKKRRAEVVYIDKDHFHLVATPRDAAEPVFREMSSCPTGFASKKETAKGNSAVQVQLDVIVAQIDRTALPNATYRWAEKQFGFAGDETTFSVVKDRANSSSSCKPCAATATRKSCANPKSKR